MNDTSRSRTPEGVGAVLDQLADAARETDAVRVGEIADRFGGRGFGPFLLLPALIEISPIGGIPGLPTVLALIIAVFAVQILLGREQLWLPRFIKERTLSARRVAEAVARLRPLALWLDRRFHGRLETLVTAPFVKLAAVVVILACLLVPFLELLPFASTIPMAVVIVFGLAMTVRDGLLMALGFAATLAGAVGLWLIAGSGA
ncbi:exopolysaccharide biosynthesis protein [Aureimonas sp. AU4]|uniref:exopolysaccharide biosynthesis protein n=1 Tax=Aureimonas sp. AU4 TaxID=1638163 RepID=UPI000705D071|nr:exopolysaccharide biosynthesis protein [Aureimonas sp. AU4]BAT30300.1 exopolysaccharide synthesis, exoD [Aureimonas sp. AU4]